MKPAKKIRVPYWATAIAVQIFMDQGLFMEAGKVLDAARVIARGAKCSRRTKGTHAPR